MTLLEQVRPHIGVFYSDPHKVIVVQDLIDGAIGYFKGAGWDIGPVPSPEAVNAIILYCKMAHSTDPAQFNLNHPSLIAAIAQGRAGGSA